jgi:DNA-binding HxlR family transcriptional regulator
MSFETYVLYYLYASHFLRYPVDMQRLAKSVKPRRPAVPANSAVRALAILGDRWALLVLRDAFLGIRRFSDFQGRLGIAPTVLTRRLAQLVRHGLLRRARAGPLQVEYHLTGKGLDVYPVALMLLRWETQWFPARAAIVLHHASCGRRTLPRFTCGGCGEEIDPHQVRYEDGPGAGRDPATARRLRRPSISAADNRANQRHLEHAADLLGDRWSWEIIGGAFLGRRRFDEIQSTTGMASNILSARLARLIDEGVITRRAYQERPPRYEYILTAKGRDLYPAIVMLMRWGDRWLAGKCGPPLMLFHGSCGRALDPQVTCSACGERLDARAVRYEFEPRTQVQGSA